VRLRAGVVVVVGSSGGGRITPGHDRRHPDLVRGAILSEPPVFPALAPHTAPEFFASVAPRVKTAAGHGDPRGAVGDPRGAVDAFMGVVCPGL
jgi:pimeloyl-ACP methyl ester carboxylesterase